MNKQKPQSTFVCDMKHKHKVGDKVVLTIEAEVTGLMPYTFGDPGYTVKIGKVPLAVSERSLEKVETHTSECHS